MEVPRLAEHYLKLRIISNSGRSGGYFKLAACGGPVLRTGIDLKEKREDNLLEVGIEGVALTPNRK